MGKVVVVGSINMDVVATAPHHPVVGETVLGRDLQFVPGGKGANQAVAAARLGAPTSLVGRVGTDAFGASLLAFLRGEGVTLDGVTETEARPTGTALIVVAGTDNTIVVVPGANAAVSTGDLDGVELEAGDVVVAQCEIPLDVVGAALARARAAGATTVLNPAPALAGVGDLLGLADVVVLNETELGQLGHGGGPSTVEQAGTAAGALASRPGQAVITTLGAAGAVVSIDGRVVHVKGRDVAVVDTTGAGDCFVGALAVGLCEGTEVVAAIRFANAAASLAVQRFGAGPGMPTRSEVDAVA